jgi:hypothetical protein
MGRNNEKYKSTTINYKAQDNKASRRLRKEKLKQISIKFNQSKTSENNI